MTAAVAVITVRVRMLGRYELAREPVVRPSKERYEPATRLPRVGAQFTERRVRAEYRLTMISSFVFFSPVLYRRLVRGGYGSGLLLILGIVLILTGHTVAALSVLAASILLSTVVLAAAAAEMLRSRSVSAPGR